MASNDIRNAGLKLTKPRAKVLEVLELSSERHHSAEDVYRMLVEKGHDFGLGTVYRVLTQFESAGLLERHYFESGHAVFELISDSHHDHLVCLECGDIQEFCDPKIESIQENIAKEKGFKLLDHSHVIQGYCRKCSENLGLNKKQA